MSSVRHWALIKSHMDGAAPTTMPIQHRGVLSTCCRRNRDQHDASSEDENKDSEQAKNGNNTRESLQQDSAHPQNGTNATTISTEALESLGLDEEVDLNEIAHTEGHVDPEEKINEQENKPDTDAEVENGEDEDDEEEAIYGDDEFRDVVTSWIFDMQLWAREK
ncbi:hypothetical protein BDV96DRAFT_598477 [Lophiotrema nucula]|uniref:Uncharacterized protein n=1 Tax=Lophiotrema nucula TaxID=690887 RepID=A0A6A5ZDS1_9PLEO|nr:hypothetical protein BDV96DRAFT_598477 [Lophiotrema nucula]